ELAVSYLGREDLAHVGIDELESVTDPVEDSPIAVAAAPVEAQVEAPAAVAPSAPVAPAAPAPVAAAPAAVAAHPIAVATTTTSTAVVVERTTTLSLRDEARRKGYEGDPCDECGRLMMVRNGTCLKCMNCGATSGCS